jgi:ethanolamine utilization protein EutM
MERQALGLIEAVGFVSAMEATDAAAKASSIVVIRTEVTDPGYVTIYIEGELAAVQAAVDAGASACERLGRVLAKTVIARPHDDLGIVIDRPNQKWRGRTGGTPAVSLSRSTSEPRPQAMRQPQPTVTRPIGGTQDYESMTVSALRRLARRRGDLSISGREIAHADKETLIRLLREAHH